MTPAPPVLTPGDPAGIGGELALMAWRAGAANDVPPFAVLDDPERLRRLAATLGWDVPVAAIADPREAAHRFAGALPVVKHTFPRPVTPGTPDSGNAHAVVEAIDRAVQFARAGHAGAVVTNPIAKAVVRAAGFAHPGHTEYLAHLASTGDAVPEPVMMLAAPELRVVPVTVHMALKDVPGTLTAAAITHAVRTTARGLSRDFGVEQPRIAVAGLNPHAGEDGAMGREEIEVISPALESLRAEGLDVRGPLSADTLFHADARGGYDAAVCMYHDQALIPLKTLDFTHGVNITLGLPFVRTSPDHGTAFRIAGTGTADPTSLLEALRTARIMAANRTALDMGRG